jgi:hypothetical protein
VRSGVAATSSIWEPIERAISAFMRIVSITTLSIVDRKCTALRAECRRKAGTRCPEPVVEGVQYAYRVDCVVSVYEGCEPNTRRRTSNMIVQ